LQFLIKIPTLQWRAVHFTLKSAMVSGLIILHPNSMTAQLQKLWIFYYIPSHYSSVLFRSLHYTVTPAPVLNFTWTADPASEF